MTLSKTDMILMVLRAKRKLLAKRLSTDPELDADWDSCMRHTIRTIMNRPLPD